MSEENQEKTSKYKNQQDLYRGGNSGFEKVFVRKISLFRSGKFSLVLLSLVILILLSSQFLLNYNMSDNKKIIKSEYIKRFFQLYIFLAECFI
jgi:zona occludens toxin (predicted ATPase)